MNAPERPHLAVVNGHATTTSNQLAENFGKRHDHVLRAIRNLDCSPEFNARNFGAVEYADEKGEKRPAYTITRDGFVFLAMGFTGKEAAQWKEAYIEAFNAMEAALLAAPSDALPKPRSVADTLCNRGMTCAERTAQQAIALAGNMLAVTGLEASSHPARVALYTAAMSLLNSAGEALKQERARLCRELEKQDGSAIGDSKKWPEAAALLNLGKNAALAETAPRIALEGGAA